MGNYTFSAKELFIDKFNNLYSLDFDDTIYFCSNIGKSRSLSQLVYDGKTEPNYAVKETYEELHVSTLWKEEKVEEEFAPESSGSNTAKNYFNNVVKRYLLELKDSIKNAKNDPEANFYKDRYAVQLKDFARAMGISEENLSLMMEKVNQLLDENPEYFYDEDVNIISPKQIDQYELKHKMTSVQCKLFKSYLHHEENISYEDMLVGDHGDEGKDLVLFNVSELKAKSVQKLQDQFVIPLKNLSSAVDEIQKLASKNQFPILK
jgi:hypothetical protein